jgi:hypothetical protein
VYTPLHSWGKREKERRERKYIKESEERKSSIKKALE